MHCFIIISKFNGFHILFCSEYHKSSFRTLICLNMLNKTTLLTIICHHSVCVIYDLTKAGRPTQLLIIEDQAANYKLCFLSEEKLFGFIVDLNKTILAAFIKRLVRHQGKTKLNGETISYYFPESSKFFQTPCTV